MQTIIFTDIIPGFKAQYNKRHLMTYVFVTLKSRSHVKVKGHRRGGVCVLWILLVLFDYHHLYNTTCTSWYEIKFGNINSKSIVIQLNVCLVMNFCVQPFFHFFVDSRDSKGNKLVILCCFPSVLRFGSTLHVVEKKTYHCCFTNGIKTDDKNLNDDFRWEICKIKETIPI